MLWNHIRGSCFSTDTWPHEICNMTTDPFLCSAKTLKLIGDTDVLVTNRFSNLSKCYISISKGFLFLRHYKICILIFYFSTVFPESLLL